MGSLVALERAEVGDAHPTKLTLVGVHPPVNRVDMHGQGALADALSAVTRYGRSVLWLKDFLVPNLIFELRPDLESL